MIDRFTRRDLLAAFLGLPFALAACRSSTPAARYDGALVGASAELGHRLRDGYRPTPPADAFQEIDVVIVGGGPAGLSAAWRLTRAGHTDHVVLELEPELGGTSRSGRNQVSAYPWGAHYLPVPMPSSRALIRLLREMGIASGLDDRGRPLIGEEHLVRAPEERIFYHGQWWEGLYLRPGASAEDIRQLEAFHREIDRWVAWRDGRGRRAFTIPVSQGSDDPEVTALDRLSMADWMAQRGFTSPRLRWWVDYACRDDYGTTPETTSAWAGVFYFASRLEQPGAEPEELMTWPAGNGHLVAWLKQQIEPRARPGTAVLEVVPGAEGERVAVHVLDAARGKLSGYRARRVIFAAPVFLARHLIRPFRDQPPGYLAEFEHGPWAVANLTLSGRPRQRGFPPAWDNVLYDSPSLGYVSATHQALKDYGPTVWTWYYPLTDPDSRAARRRLLETDWRGWADVAVNDLKRAHPDLEQHLERIDVMRWGHAMIRPRPGFVWGGARQQAMTPHRGVHFAHTDLSGIALFEEANDHGIRAAEEVLAALDLPFDSFR